MTFKLNIECDNAAFEDNVGEEVGRILRQAAQKMERGDIPGTLFDSNGNAVGEAVLMP